MNCCRNCFSSNYLKSFFNDKELGDCDFCNSKNQPILHPETFFDQFSALLEYYKVDDNGSYIESQIHRDFPKQIFTDSEDFKVKELLQEIVKSNLVQYQGLFDNKIILAIKADGRHLVASAEYSASWDEFKKEIKFVNRFHIENAIDLDKLSSYFKKSLSKEINPGDTYFRGRISTSSGFPCGKDLINPPKELAKAGRANPLGISYLYLSDTIKTSLYETRSTIYDFVAIGEFKVKEKLLIVDLRDIAFEPILWAENQDLVDYLVYIPFLNILQSELALPIRSTDKEIDYLPTQYLSEFIKSLNYDGVKFQSSLHANGFNMAIFNPLKLECVNSKLYEIKNIDYDFSEINPPS